MSNRISLEFDGFDVLKKQLDELGGEATERAVTDALKASQSVIARNVESAMQTHNRSGAVSRSIINGTSPKWTGTTAEIGVGFKISDGGLPSIFLMYGTKLHGQPHVKPDRKLFNAVYGKQTIDQIHAIQREAFEKVLERVMK